MRDSDRQSEFSAAHPPFYGRHGDKLRSLKANCWARMCGALILCMVTAMSLWAQRFAKIHNFDSMDGATPKATLVQGTDGYLYGTTYGGGPGGRGTVFKVAPNGSFTMLYSFCLSPCTGGGAPLGALVQPTTGNWYGTTSSYGTNGEGAVFTLAPSGALTTIYDFCSQGNCIDGADPAAGLMEGNDGEFYGTTTEGGKNASGAVFKITTGGVFTTLYSFCALRLCADGLYPEAPLIQGADGNFYGTTLEGGSQGIGSVFKITPGGTLTTLYNFCSQSGCADGSLPETGLVQGPDGSLYGTTESGGTNADCDGSTCGTVFKMTPAGALTTLHSFCSRNGCTDGAHPQGGLIIGNDGNLYGTTSEGGDSGAGSVFKITPGGTLTTLYSFCPQPGCTDGEYPVSGLVQGTNGEFYGTASAGGPGVLCGTTGGCGTIFSLSVGLPAFVHTQPGSAKVGKPVNILGTNLTGATSVTFNGTPATFTVVSPSLIRTTVPAGATTGTVQVVTPGGTLKSNVPFRVVQ